MMNWKKGLRKGVAALLCCSLAFSAVPLLALAEGETDVGATSTSSVKVSTQSSFQNALQGIGMLTETLKDTTTQDVLDNLNQQQPENISIRTEQSVNYTEGNITYTFTINDTSANAALTGITVNEGTNENVTIPSTFTSEGKTYSVTAVDIYYSGREEDNFPSITQLTLPDSVTDVNGSNFRGFTDLIQITIPGSIKNFDGLFQYMDNLETITFLEGIEEISSSSMVAYCEKLTTIYLPDSLTVISENATFADAPSLTNITLPSNVTFTDGGSMFSGDISLESITLPTSVTTIYYSMFEGCTNLKEVIATSTITSIEDKAFSGASPLTTLPDFSHVTSMGADVFTDYDYESSFTGPIDLSSLTEIPDYTFAGTKLQSITFGDNLISIGESAFEGTSLSQLSLPSSLQSIGDYAFWGNSTLTGELIIPDSVTSIGASAFSDCSGITSISIGSGVKEIGADAFKGCTALQHVIIDNSSDGLTGVESAFPAGVNIQYTVQSIDDAVGDQISNQVDALTLQDAVNEAAQNGGGVIKIEKNIKLMAPVNVPAGDKVTITSDEAFQILGVKNKISNLFNIEAGASLEITGNIILSGRYNTAALINNKGSFTLSGNAEITGATVTQSQSGVVSSTGKSASFTLAGGKIHNNKIEIQSGSKAGTVYVSDGATFSMTGGSIENNAAVSGNASTHAASGLLLYGSATGIMEGGSICNNSAYRGAAVVVLSQQTASRAKFTMNDGEITNNKFDFGDQSAGAVYLERNAEFIMNGGRIEHNTGNGKGGGVCVVDTFGKSYPTGQYNTSFSMNGGSISYNSAKTGGGIYSYSQGVILNAGDIIGNTASYLGGGIYSEGNYQYYSTLHLANAAIYENTAGQGGGMWFCPTGETTVYIDEGTAIFDNTATEGLSWTGSAGDDFVFAGSHEGHRATLPNRFLGGGAVTWYKDGSVYVAGSSLLPSVNSNIPRYGEPGADMNPVVVNDTYASLALKAVAGAEAKELAKQEAKVIITGNTAEAGGGIGANGGIVIGEDGNADKSVAVQKIWADGGEIARPQSVTVNLLNKGYVIDSVVLSEANGWTHTFTDLPLYDAEDGPYIYTVEEEYVPGFIGTVTGDDMTGFIITNSQTDTEVPPEEPEEEEPEKPEYSLSIRKVWVEDTDDTRPGSILLEIYHDGVLYDEIVLSGRRFGDSDTWRASYSIPARYAQDDWWVQEADVPAGYEDDVDETRDNVFVITNTYTVEEEPSEESSEPPAKPSEPSAYIPPESSAPASEPVIEPDEPSEPTLPQTGQLWWPVPALLIGGALLAAVGACRKSRK